MQWAALGAWILTALGGSGLFLIWFQHGGLHQHEGIRTARLVSHLTFAVVGLALWVVFLATDDGTLAWLAVALLVTVALVGFSMLIISIRGRTTVFRTEAPAEGSFPMPVVAMHGTLATATLVLSILAAAGIGT